MLHNRMNHIASFYHTTQPVCRACPAVVRRQLTTSSIFLVYARLPRRSRVHATGLDRDMIQHSVVIQKAISVGFDRIDHAAHRNGSAHAALGQLHRLRMSVVREVCRVAQNNQSVIASKRNAAERMVRRACPWYEKSGSRNAT